MKLSRNKYYDAVYGSWLGRCIGSALGAPLELRPYRYIKIKYGNITNYVRPLKDKYVNDDEMYEIVGLLTLERYGIEINSVMIGKEWLTQLWTMMFTAEKRAYQNMKKGIMPPDSGKKENNIYYDFIGGQMKADIWGQIAPCPDIAAEYAKIDGEVAHDEDGIFGEIFIATLLSHGFFSSNMKENIQNSLKYIPNDSNYAKFINLAIQLHAKYSNWRDALKELKSYWRKFKRKLIAESSSKRKLVLLSPFSSVHVLPNAGIIILSLLYGKSDFERSICISAMCGMDSDCNCGNIGAILGLLYGAKRIPSKWKSPIKNIFYTKTRAIKEIKISELAERVCKIGEKIIEKKCTNIQLNR
ncbi:MAG: ADP-ribosylglycohydrolase family protein [Candidatus Helarchaeota archaeon]